MSEVTGADLEERDRKIAELQRRVDDQEKVLGRAQSQLEYALRRLECLACGASPWSGSHREVALNLLQTSLTRAFQLEVNSPQPGALRKHIRAVLTAYPRPEDYIVQAEASLPLEPGANTPTDYCRADALEQVRRLRYLAREYGFTWETLGMIPP